MKYFNKIYIALAFALVISACSDVFELDEFLDNPNAVTEEAAGVDFLYNQIQISFANVYGNAHFITDELVRLTAMQSPNYNNELGPAAGNGIWNNFYANLLPDIQAMNVLAEARGLDIHAGTAKIMQAYAMTTMVDLFGNVPYSQAVLGAAEEQVLNPTLDSGDAVYAAATALLDEAIGQLSGTTAASPNFDNFYGGDDGTQSNPANWITLANTLKLRMANNTRLVSGAGAVATLAAGDIIDDPSEDFIYKFSTNRLNPDSRHPFYGSQYEAADGGYQSNYFMYLLCCEKEVNDPRTRYYFYRQVNDIFAESGNAFSCLAVEDWNLESVEASIPAHYTAVDPNMPFCYAAPNGWYGRDHGNGLGIPPDGPIRAVYGLYPGGGKWDGNTFSTVQNLGEDGGKGAGIWPIVTASSVAFMRAEAAFAGSGEDTRALLEEGVRQSIDKVLSFESISAGDFSSTVVDPITGEEVARGVQFGPSSADIEEYVGIVLDLYDNSSDQLDVIMKEFLISLPGNGLEAYNAYRRTGKPNNMQPIQDIQTVDPFPTSVLLPTNHVNLNVNAVQKSLGDKVFWDNGSAATR